jgi:hypothetical protein
VAEQLDLLPTSLPPGPFEVAVRDRANFVRGHVRAIIQKVSTARAHRTKGKKLLEKSEAAGDTGAGNEVQAEYEMAAAADREVEQHILALISRTEFR